MYILAVESSCDETSSAIVRVEADGSFTVCSNIIASQVEMHRLYGGVVPEIAGRAHIEAVSPITYQALEEAHLTPKDLDLVAVTGHPGLIGALLVGVNFAKSFAFSHHLPLVEVDHMKGHVSAAFLNRPVGETPQYPFLALVVSGGHTSFYEVKSPVEYTVIGETRDDAMGEAFDKIGRRIGIPYPAGRGFDSLATEGFLRFAPDGTVDAAYRRFAEEKVPLHTGWKLPSPALAGDNLDFSFSGLKTASIQLLHHMEQKGEHLDRPLFAAVYTYTAVEAVVKKAGEAMERYPYRDLVMAGGVCANSHLRRRMTELCRAHGRVLHVPPVALCGDNGAMIAVQGYHEWKAGRLQGPALNASAADM